MTLKRIWSYLQSLFWSGCDWHSESIRGSLYLWEPGMRALSDNSLARGTIAALSASRFLSKLTSSPERILCERLRLLQSWSHDLSYWEARHKAYVTGLNNSGGRGLGWTLALSDQIQRAGPSWQPLAALIKGVLRLQQDSNAPFYKTHLSLTPIALSLTSYTSLQNVKAVIKWQCISNNASTISDQTTYLIKCGLYCGLANQTQ